MSLQPPGDMLDAPQQNNTLSVNVLAHKTAFVEAFRNCGSTNKTSTPDQQDGENQIQASPLADEVPENTSVPDVAQESEITKPTFSGGRWIFPATSAQSIENSVDEDIGDSTSGAGEEVLSSLPLSQLRPVRVTYPDTIDVDLPDSFLEDDGIQPVSHKVKKRQDKLVWSEQRADEQFPGCHPNVMIRRYAAVPRLSTISITFIKAPPPLLRLPVEIRLQILGHLLTSEHPIINPYVNRPREPEEKWSVDARILRTCPCMYTEGRWILYQSNTFRFTEQAAFDTWRLSQHRIHRHVRHLELHTKVAEKFCYRRVRVQGQTMQLFRVRIPAGWDWPFANPWHFTHLHTLKLDLKDFDSLPVTFSSRKQQAGPDPDARNPRVPPVTKRDLLAYIRKASNAPLLMDVEVAGATYSLQILLFELSMRVLGFCRILDYNTRCREMTSYLEERIGGRWETQDLATRMNWENLKRALSRSVDQAAQRGETKRYENYRVDYDFALLMWMRKRHAERSSTKA